MKPLIAVMSLCIGLLWGGGVASSQTVCQTDGPDLNTTWQYINNAMTSAGTTDKFNLRTYTDTAEVAIFTGRQNLIRNSHGTFSYEDALDETASINTLNCASYGAESRTDGFLVYVKCIGNQSCAKYDGGDNANAFGLLYHGDVDHAKRLATALSHYLYLVQQDWKKAHDDPNDPFSHK
jgi:hypothetical protein